MIESMQISQGLSESLFWIAQVIINDEPEISPAQASVFTQGPRFFIVLIAGVILAFAIQLVLTNLSVASGLSYLGNSSDTSDSSSNSDNSLGGTIRKISTAVGLWTLITVTISLAIACFLAVKLSLMVFSPGLGAILGLVVWAAYFLLLTWVSSATVGSLVGNVVDTATSGFKAVMGTATAALGASAVNRQVVNTAEAAASAVRRELGSAVDPEGIREKLEDYVEMLRPPELDMGKIRAEFEQLLNDPQLKAIATSGDLSNIDKQRFVDLVSSRTDLSRRDANRISDTLYSVWQQVVGQQSNSNTMNELVEYLKTLPPGQTKTDELNAKLDRLIAEMRSPARGGDAAQVAKATTPGPIQRTAQQALMALSGTVMGRADLSDLDVEQIIGAITQAKDKATTQADKMGLPKPSEPYNPIRADVEYYLHNTFAWQSRERMAEEFRDVLYDPTADPGVVRRQLERINRSDFADILQQRGLLTQAEIKRIADRLEAVREAVLIHVRAEEEKEIVHDLQRRVGSYLLVTPKSELTPEGIERNFKPLIADSDADYETLSVRLAMFDRQSMRNILLERNDMYQEEEVTIILDELEKQRDKVLVESKGLADQAKYQAESLWLNLESYLRNTGKDELNPDAIRGELKTLLHDPQAGVSAISARASRFDRDTLVQLLNQRRDLSEDQINQTIDTVEDSWRSVRYAPQALAHKAKSQYDSVTTTIADYLRNTGKDELNPQGIKRDFARLFENPQEGTVALRRRLSQVDRDTLVQLLSQRQDLSEEQVNQVIDSLQSSIRDIIRAPKRLAIRTQQRAKDFQTNLSEYLRETGKEELNPEGIKRDLNLLLNDPGVGMESLSDRLSRFDRSTIVALLKIRDDISDTEAEQIADNIMSVQEQFVTQVRNIQRKIQDVIDGVFNRIRNYLNSLERPELNYDGIRRDLRTVFDDPQAGFEALRDRLASFNRETYVALISSREDISEEDANRIIDQVDRARNSVLQRAERIQNEAQRRLEEVKYQAQRQAEETRKAAASAAWWLFGTAVVSAIFSAAAGALASIAALD